MKRYRVWSYIPNLVGGYPLVHLGVLSDESGKVSKKEIARQVAYYDACVRMSRDYEIAKHQSDIATSFFRLMKMEPYIIKAIA